MRGRLRLQHLARSRSPSAGCSATRSRPRSSAAARRRCCAAGPPNGQEGGAASARARRRWRARATWRSRAFERHGVREARAGAAGSTPPAWRPYKMHADGALREVELRRSTSASPSGPASRSAATSRPTQLLRRLRRRVPRRRPRRRHAARHPGRGRPRACTARRRGSSGSRPSRASRSTAVHARGGDRRRQHRHRRRARAGEPRRADGDACSTAAPTPRCPATRTSWSRRARRACGWSSARCRRRVRARRRRPRSRGACSPTDAEVSCRPRRWWRSARRRSRALGAPASPAWRVDATGGIAADPATGRTGNPKVFAGGDARQRRRAGRHRRAGRQARRAGDRARTAASSSAPDVAHAWPGTLSRSERRPWRTCRSTSRASRAPNPFWLASAPPTNTGDQVMRAFDAGWGGAVWKTLGDPIVDTSSRFGALSTRRRSAWSGFNNIELITDRPLEVNLREIARGQEALPEARGHRLADGRVQATTGARSSSAPRTPAATGSSSTSAARTACASAAWARRSARSRRCSRSSPAGRSSSRRVPVLVKLTPNVGDIRVPGAAAVEAGVARRCR